MEKVDLNVEGMSCGHCEKSVKDALTDIGVNQVKADHTKNLVSVEFDPLKVSLDDIKKEIVELEYIVK